MQKVIWITGAGSGIGKAIAMNYAENSNIIIASGRKTQALEALAQELEANNCSIIPLPLDISDESSIETAVSTVIEKYGRIDILVNNAGISQRSLVKETKNEVGRQIMDINFFGTVQLTKAVLPYMLDADSGDIVVISSAAGKFGFHNRSYYSASKHALHGFFDSLSLELHKTGINVLLVCPGRIKTELSKSALVGDGSAYEKQDDRLEGGVTADKCAKAIKRAVSAKKKEIYLGGREVILIYIKRLFPALYRFIAARVKAE